MGILGDIYGAAADIGAAVLDVPADAVHVFQKPGRQVGPGYDTGWFGQFDDAAHDFADTVTGTADPKRGGDLGLFGDIDKGFHSFLVGKPDEWADASDPKNNSLLAGMGAAGNILTQTAGGIGDVTADPALAFLGFDVETQYEERRRMQNSGDRTEPPEEQGVSGWWRGLAIAVAGGLVVGALIGNR